MAQEAVGSSPIAHPTIYADGLQANNLQPVFFIPRAAIALFAIYLQRLLRTSIFPEDPLQLALYSKCLSQAYNLTNSMTNIISIDTPEILQLLFQPPDESADDCPAYAQDIVLTVAPGVSLNCRFYPSAPDAPTLLYFHGGTESCTSFNAEGNNYVRHGINVFLASYRGYGRSTGTPSIASMMADGNILFAMAADWLATQGYSGPLFVMGRSLGSVCAIDIVQRHGETAKGLLIESGFCETASLLLTLGAAPAVVPPTEAEGFDNLRKIAAIKLPTLIFHGAKDALVPVAHAEKLQAAAGARNKQFFIIPGATHDTVSKTGGELYYRKIKEFINEVCGLNTWRQRRREFKKGGTGESA